MRVDESGNDKGFEEYSSIDLLRENIELEGKAEREYESTVGFLSKKRQGLLRELVEQGRAIEVPNNKALHSVADATFQTWADLEWDLRKMGFSEDEIRNGLSFHNNMGRELTSFLERNGWEQIDGTDIWVTGRELDVPSKDDTG